MFGRRGKPWVVLLCLAAAWWLLPGVLRRAAETSFAEFQAPLQHAYGQAVDLRTFWTLRSRSNRELIEANRDLARVNQAYALDRERIGALEAEIGRLEALLELPSEPAYRYEIARVAHRDYTIWWERLVIRKGREAGLEPGQAVIYAGGVAGRIREVRATTAIVELASSPGFRMAASLPGIDSPVTYQGLTNVPLEPPRGEALNLPPEVSLAQDEPLLLRSSQLGGIFPAGLPIGTIVALSPGSEGYFQRGLVELPASLGSLREVAVVVPISPDTAE